MTDTNTHWTPGPWKVDGAGVGRLVIYSGQPIAHVFVGKPPEKLIPNVHLIAAAPELASALAELLVWVPTAIEGDYEEDEPIEVALRNARAALSKARGESQ